MIKINLQDYENLQDEFNISSCVQIRDEAKTKLKEAEINLQNAIGAFLKSKNVQYKNIDTTSYIASTNKTISIYFDDLRVNYIFINILDKIVEVTYNDGKLINKVGLENIKQIVYLCAKK